MVQIQKESPNRQSSNDDEKFLLRWESRSAQRKWNTEKSSQGRFLDVDDPQRATARLRRLSADPVARAIMKEAHRRAPVDPLSPAFQEFAEERLIGGVNDIVDLTFMKIGLEVAKTICRLNYARGSGFGTGFLVSPRLLMTNHHVLEDKDSAANTVAEFNYENDQSMHLEDIISLSLRPDQFFLTSEELDFTIVAINEPERAATLGYNKLFGEEGKAVIGEHINIIQHPNGQPKALCVSNNQLVDVFDNYLHYVTDTLPGSSGSPVYNNQWELIALHHTGVARRNTKNEALLKDGSVWQKGIPDSQVDWVANEGVRVSRIVKEVKLLMGEQKSNGYVSELLGVEGIMQEIVDRTKKSEIAQPVSKDLRTTGQITVNIPITIQISLDGTGQATVKTASGTVEPQTSQRPSSTTRSNKLTPLAEIVQTENFEPDHDWSTRTGYDAAFLGRNTKVPVPGLSSDQQSKAAKVDSQYRSANGEYVLDYSHYSVVMNAERRLAYFSAGNIDGKNWFKIKRAEGTGGSDRWYFDDRIAKEEQVGDQLYANNDIDRGHIIRREYMTWGTREEALQANNDTFMFTNCSPQHKDLNQGKDQWLGLEDYVLTHAKNESQRICVFAGPIFGKNDPEYRQLIQIPLAFWKVVVMLSDDKKLSATGYILKQEGPIRDAIRAEEAVLGDFNNYQVPISYISEKTKLGFGNLINADPLNKLTDEELYSENAFVKGRLIRSTKDITLF